MAKEKTPTATKTSAKPASKAPAKPSVPAGAKTSEKPAAKASAKAPAKTPATKPVAKASVPVEEKKEVKDVHTLAFVTGKGWAVKRQGSEKVIKYFKTKYEATEYIVQVSGNQKTSIIIRLKNGKFQKFDNAMKALSYAKSAKEDE